MDKKISYENFIDSIIAEDLKKGFNKKDLKFRFPPEPNGFLHIGHLKALDLNFSLGEKYNASVNLRFDDTNPSNESTEFVNAIRRDIKWLGYNWDKECYASDYFEILYKWSLILIENNLAYIDSQDSETIASQKGTLNKPGKNSPYRNRSVKENIKIFEEMKQGVHKEGEHVLRAKIDMGSSNLLMRDPIMYRVIFKNHHRLKKKWCLFPTYDWTHGQSDYIERISHSLCSLEFKPHRDLYEWFLNRIANKSIKYPKQREFARLNLSYTIMSKRKLAELVDNGHVKGWDDPRMPTISGLRRRGYTPEALKKFIKTAGISKRENLIDVSLLEYCIRENLNKVANRVMVVLDPVKLIITNYPEDKNENVQIVNNPEDLNSGTRNVSFSREIYIEREDFKEIANRKYFRLSIGKEVRLKSAYIIKAITCNKDNNGEVTEILCEYDPKSKSGSGTNESERKVKGTIHWVSKSNSLDAEVNLYDRLFKNEFPEKTKGISFVESFNENSLKKINVKAERSLENSKVGQIFQFQRKGYFVVDDDSKKGSLIFNRTVELRDNWTKKN